MELTKEQIGWLMELVNEYDAVSHPLALGTYVKLAKEFNQMLDTHCECGDKLEPCGMHCEVDPSHPCRECAQLLLAAQHA